MQDGQKGNREKETIFTTYMDKLLHLKKKIVLSTFFLFKISDLEHLTREGLLFHLQYRNLPIHGTRAEMIDRLRVFLQLNSSVSHNVNTFSGDDWPYVVRGNVSHCVSDTKLSEGKQISKMQFFFRLSFGSISSTSFQVGKVQ